MRNLPNRYGFLGVGVVITALLVSACALDEPYACRQMRSAWYDAFAVQVSLTEVPHNMSPEEYRRFHDAGEARYRILHDAQRIGCDSIAGD